MSHHVVNILAHLTFITFNSQNFATNLNGEDRIIRKIHNVGVDVMLHVIRYIIYIYIYSKFLIRTNIQI